jgi:hypothetical protein
MWFKQETYFDKVVNALTGDTAQALYIGAASTYGVILITGNDKTIAPAIVKGWTSIKALFSFEKKEEVSPEMAAGFEALMELADVLGVDTETGRVDAGSATRDQLRGVAKEMGIDGYSKMTKAQLLESIDSFVQERVAADNPPSAVAVEAQ